MIDTHHFEKALTGNPAISGDLAHSAGKTEVNPANGIAAGEKTFSPAIHERKGHTPGPYLRDGALIYALDESRTSNRISMRVEGGFIQNWKSACRRTTDEEAEATAEFAQRACNNHYELLEALKAVLSELEHKGSDGWMTGNVHGDDYDRARAAITKAEG